MYNLSKIVSNSTGLLSVTQNVNEELMYGYFGLMIILSIFLVLVIAFYQSTNNMKKALGSSAFICFVLCLIFSAVNLVSDKLVIVSLLAAGLTIALTWKKDY